MSSTTQPDVSGVEQGRRRSPLPFGRALDWIVALFLFLWGVAFAAGGFSLFQAADLAQISQWVADGVITSTELTDAQLVDVVYALAWWGGIGMAVTGVLLAIAGVAFLGFGARSRRQFAATGAGRPGLLTSAILGAIVTFVTSAIPFSPIIGGAVAAYFRESEGSAGLRTGGITGLVAILPVAIVLGFVAVGTVTSGVPTSSIVGVLLGTVALFTLLYFVALSAIGGYVGVALANRTVD